MLQAITIDPAMLVYLDGDPSVVEAPNENYSREVMELFALGIRAYTEADVHAGAKALAGWDVNYDTGVASFLPRVPRWPSTVTFLGRSVIRAADVVNTVCDSPTSAPFIAGKLYKFFMGADPSASRRTELATVFRDGNLEIRPLVEAILRDPMFFDPRCAGTTPRMPVEWVPAAFAAINRSNPDQATNVADGMGQVPFYPPSVAGWPGGTRFLAASDARSRADVGDNAPTLADRDVRRSRHRHAQPLFALRGHHHDTQRAHGRRGIDRERELACSPPPRPRDLIPGPLPRERRPAPQGVAVGARRRGPRAGARRVPAVSQRARATDDTDPPTQVDHHVDERVDDDIHHDEHDDHHDDATASAARQRPLPRGHRHAGRARRLLDGDSLRRRHAVLPAAAECLDPGQPGAPREQHDRAAPEPPDVARACRSR